MESDAEGSRGMDSRIRIGAENTRRLQQRINQLEAEIADLRAALGMPPHR